ncbi:MAG: hypothetical protein ACOY4R_31475 [Pseudomonadota bacterium]
MKIAKQLVFLVTAGCISLAAAASAQTHPMVGKWREKISHTGDVDLVITGIGPDGLITGTFEVPRYSGWNCTFSDRVDPTQKLATGKVNGEALFVTLANGTTYDLKLEDGMLVGMARGGRTWPMRFRRQ